MGKTGRALELMERSNSNSAYLWINADSRRGQAENPPLRIARGVLLRSLPASISSRALDIHWTPFHPALPYLHEDVKRATNVEQGKTKSSAKVGRRPLQPLGLDFRRDRALFNRASSHPTCTGMLRAPMPTSRPAAPETWARRAAWHDHEQHCLAWRPREPEGCGQR